MGRDSGQGPPLVGVGGMNPNFLNPEGALLGLGGVPGLHARVVRTSLGWGSVYLLGSSFQEQVQTAGPAAESSWERLSGLGWGGTAWWARPSVLISRPGIWDETRSPPPPAPPPGVA